MFEVVNLPLLGPFFPSDPGGAFQGPGGRSQKCSEPRT
jgi:hypothetical protein